MTRLGVVAIGLALTVSTTAWAQTVGEGGSAALDRQQLREQLKNSGNPSGSTCPIKILADYGNRVAAEAGKQSRPKATWAAGGKW